jgi:hypothetical protein
MSDELSGVEKSVEEFLIDLMAERVMSTRVQASSMRGVQASPSTARGSGPSRAAKEKKNKHRDDLANVKLIPSILPDYIPPLAGVVSRDSVPRDFDYTVIMTYLLKGICAVRPQLERIQTLKISDYNLGDRKTYDMLEPHKYLTKMKGNKSKIIPHPWTMNIAQSIILNVMKIPHFGRNQEVNACVKLLLSSFHDDYLWIDRRITIDLGLIHRITDLSMQGPDPQRILPHGKAADHALE